MTVHVLFILSSLFLVANCSGSESFDKVEKQDLKEANTASGAGPSLDKEPPYVREKNGNYKLNWEIFREYDLNSKKAGKNLKQVLNKSISITGFMMPLDYSRKNIKEFLLVPYIPSCAHVPPPPPNMIIKVKAKKKNDIRFSYYPVKVVGKLELIKSMEENVDYGAFFLAASSMEEVKY